MSEGWKCPVCNRGVRPDKDTCDHGGMGALPPLPHTSPWRPVVGGSPCPNIALGAVSVSPEMAAEWSSWQVN